MVLYFTSIDKHNEYRDFFCELATLEDAFGLLNLIVAGGNLLLSAKLLENETSLSLPVEAF